MASKPTAPGWGRLPRLARWEEVRVTRERAGRRISVDTGTNIWSYSREDVSEPIDVEGFKVEATDGDIGRIDEATYEVGASYVVVDTGPWIFGRKVVLPAGAIETIDLDNQKVVVRLTKDQIKGSPELDETTDFRSDEHRSSLGDYYDSYVRL
jgi:hypothetical protein